MSLVNDALQRAKQHTAQPAPAPTLQLRPLEPTTKAPEPLIRKFPMVITILALVAVALLFTGLFHRGNGTPDSAKASVTLPATETKPSIQIPNPAASVKVSDPVPVIDPKSEPAKAPAELPVVAVQSSPPTPAPPKLQAIFYNKSQPSVMINGKTLHLGNLVGGFRVTAITPNSATLVSETKTNILSFAE